MFKYLSKKKRFYYKNKNNMKTLVESLKSSLISEGIGKYIMVNDHNSPDMLYIVENPSKTTIKLLSERFNVEEIIDLDNIAYIEWNDEYLSGIGIGKNINDVKKNVEKNIMDSLDEMGYSPNDEVEEVFNGFSYINPYMVRKKYEKVIWNHFKEYIEYSYVDKDSRSCKAIIDLKNYSILVCGNGDITFYDDKEAREVLLGI